MEIIYCKANLYIFWRLLKFAQAQPLKELHSKLSGMKHKNFMHRLLNLI